MNIDERIEALTMNLELAMKEIDALSAQELHDKMVRISAPGRIAEITSGA